MPVPVPPDVIVDVSGSMVSVRGPRGNLSHEVPSGITVRQDDGQLIVERASDEGKLPALHGLSRSLVNNMVVGVSQGFEKRLEIVGTGYRALAADDVFTISVGFSHPVEMRAPEGAHFTMEGPRMVVSGIDKQVVGELAAKIRRVRPPEPYKGKGIRYMGEYVRRKAGKAGSKKR